MKRILSVFLSVLLLLTMMPVGIVAVAAEDAPTISLVAPGQGVERGATFTVDVVMSGNPGIICWRTRVDYDSTVLELVDQTAGDTFDASQLSFGPLHSPASAMWCDAISANSTANGVMYTLTFLVLADVEAGTYPLTLSVLYPEDDILNYDMEAVYFDLVSTTVTVVDHHHAYDNACDYDCNICGEVREAEPHNYVGRIQIAPTCVDDGVMRHTCTVCGDNFTVAIPAAGAHTYTDDCDGSCNVCGATRVAPHVYDHVADTTCNLCGIVRDLGEVPTIYVAVPEDAVTIDGTFTVDVKAKNNPGIVGWHLYLSYDSTALELISAIGGAAYGSAGFGPLTSPLSALWVDAIHGDVTDDGVLYTLTFRVLKDVDGAYDLALSVPDWEEFFNNEFDTVYFDLQDATLLTAVHTHIYDSAVTIAPTCLADGVKTYTCSVCGDAYTESVPALGHDYKPVVTAPTCEAEGYTTHTCSRCGDSYVDDEVAALGHA